MSQAKAQPDPVAALVLDLPACRRLTAKEVRDVRESSATQSILPIAGRLQIPPYVVSQILSGRYFTIV